MHKEFAMCTPSVSPTIRILALATVIASNNITRFSKQTDFFYEFLSEKACEK